MHPTREDLTSLVLGTIDDQQAEFIASHVESCRTCEETLQQLETAIEDKLVVAVRHGGCEFPEELESGCERLVEATANLETGPGDSGRTLFQVDLSTEAITIRDYQLLELLGQGGMGAVHRAVHLRLDREVAIKVLTANRVADPMAVQRLRS